MMVKIQRFSFFGIEIRQDQKPSRNGVNFSRIKKCAIGFTSKLINLKCLFTIWYNY